MKIQNFKEMTSIRINTAKKKIRQEEMKQAIRQSWRRFEAEKRKNLPKKLGRTRFQEPDIDLKLSDEISDSLRNLKVIICLVVIIVTINNDNINFLRCFLIFISLHNF